MAKQRRNNRQVPSLTLKDVYADIYEPEEEFVDETLTFNNISDESDKEDVPKHILRKRKTFDQTELRKRIDPTKQGEGKAAPCKVAFDTQWIREEKWAEQQIVTRCKFKDNIGYFGRPRTCMEQNDVHACMDMEASIG
ncbi:hypothetical protein LXL04_020310 [Taraxacum kok-saghyz]